MIFVLRMALRETRASWRRLLFFFICLAIGVGAIVTLRSVIHSVRGVVAGEARALIAGDIVLSTLRPWSDEDRATLDRLLRPDNGVIGRTASIETATMARPADERKPLARMIELRGVEAGYPLYGRVRLRGGGEYSHALLSGNGALVRPELLTQLDVEVGDAILIGGQAFTVRGVLEAEPGGRVGGFSLGPRVLIDRAALEATGLTGYGSRVRRQIMLQVAEGREDPVIQDLRDAFRNEFVSIRWWRRTEDNIGEDLERSESYLSLVGLVVLVLGGIGVSSVTRVFVEQKLKSIAILKCVGAHGAQVLAIYLLQVLSLGLAGSLLGIGLAAGTLQLLGRFVDATGPTGEPIEYGLAWGAAWQGVLIGMLVALLFSIVPLLRVRRIRPSLLLRQEAGGGTGHDWLRAAVAVGVGLALVGVAAWQAGSLQVGLVVSGGFVAIAAALWAAGWLLVKATRPLRRSRLFALRHAALHLDRPGNQSRLVLLAVGLGCFFIVGVRAVQTNLLTQFSFDFAADMPDMFLIDIQRDQAVPLTAFLRERAAGDVPRLIPVLRARVTAVRGSEVNLDSVQEVRERGSLAREYTITYRDQLARNERIIAGRFWSGPSDQPEVSIEESIRERFHIQIGDTIRFEVLGRPIEAVVTSVRAVNWRDIRSGGFMFVFRPGVFETAPHNYIVTLRGPGSVDARARLQRDLVVAFPNVSVIDLREILETARSIVGTITLGVTIVGGLVLATGVLILTGAVAMTKFRRVYEAAILKTLGASSRLIAAMLVLEYGVLGAIAGTVGAVGAIALSWAVARFALDLPWEATPVITAAGIVATAAFVAAVGVLASLDVLRHKPLATLRAE